mgnify:FL=1
MKKKNKIIWTGSLILGMSFSGVAGAFVYFLPDYKAEELSFVGQHGPSLKEQCLNNGYTITSCPEGSTPVGVCPWHSDYYQECISPEDQCTSAGYSKDCPDGKIPDTSRYCSYDHSYIKCVCDPCEGYEYTYEEATASGYVVDGAACQSCDEMRYKRKVNPCEGFGYDASNCGVSECGTLSGATCQSGLTVKYAECKACPAPTCSDGEWNLDTYWCDGALKCLLPEK